MSGNKFNLIAQEISKQYQTMEELKLENHRLHQELDDLREGRGVFVMVEGQRFAVDVASPIQDTAAPEAPVVTLKSARTAPTNAAPKIREEPAEVAPVEKTVKRPATFLEEIMLDEFANALTAPKTGKSPAVQKATATAEAIDEDQKAALRKELLGSYLLE